VARILEYRPTLHRCQLDGGLCLDLNGSQSGHFGESPFEDRRSLDSPAEPGCRDLGMKQRIFAQKGLLVQAALCRETAW